MGYHAAGLTNLVFYAIALLGTGHQLRVIWRRRAAPSAGALARPYRFPRRWRSR